ncbi:MAG: glycine cleavage system protein GcvH [Gammaproteobacteria bacterium]|jgi:glycine cleavage system H protein|tara:strand:- start:2324 stop:2701 length:378 start_codon:yes stop_codon:yes gene_type:complete
MSIKYSKDHEWLVIDGNIGTVGISNHAQEELGDIVFVELPQVGDIVGQGDEICIIESVKAASEVLAPCSGRVIEINEVLDSNPQVINQSAEEEGWFYRLEISDVASLSELMDSEAYETFLLAGEE